MNLTKDGMDLENSIVGALEEHGFDVKRHVFVNAGKHVLNPDIVAEKGGRLLIMECKTTPATINDLAVLKSVPGNTKLIYAPKWASEELRGAAGNYKIQLVQYGSDLNRILEKGDEQKVGLGHRFANRIRYGVWRRRASRDLVGERFARPDY